MDTMTPTKSQFKRWGAAGGRKGGSRGGRNAAAALSPQQRTERARKAARARWSGKRR